MEGTASGVLQVMPVSTAFFDGMALAATAQGDRDGAGARGGLAPSLAEPFEARMRSLAALDRTQRRREVKRLAEQRRAVAEDADLPPRARALLAADVPKEVGRAWLAASPVRPGFRVTPGLKATLRRLAAPAEPDAVADEEAAAARAEAHVHAAALRRFAQKLGGERRVLGALLLGAERRLGGDATSRAWRRIGHELRVAWEGPWRG